MESALPPGRRAGRRAHRGRVAARGPRAARPRPRAPPGPHHRPARRAQADVARRPLAPRRTGGIPPPPSIHRRKVAVIPFTHTEQIAALTALAEGDRITPARVIKGSQRVSAAHKIRILTVMATAGDDSGAELAELITATDTRGDRPEPCAAP